MALYKQFIRNFCVSFGHLQIFVPHLPLQGKQIAAVFQIKGSKTVSDSIGGKFHACSITVFPEVPSQHIGLQLLPISCGEQPLFPFFRLHLVQETCRCSFCSRSGFVPEPSEPFSGQETCQSSVIADHFHSHTLHLTICQNRRLRSIFLSYLKSIILTF